MSQDDRPANENAQTADPRRDGDMDSMLRAFFEDYAAINRNARAGQEISAADFTRAEERFHEAVMDLPRGIEGSRSFRRYIEDETWHFLRRNPEVRAQLDTFALDQAFYRKHIADGKDRENTDLHPDTHTEEELIKDLLAKNNGLALSDIHTEDETFRFLLRNMETLKEAGVKTIYLEDGKKFDELNALSADALDTLAREGRYENLRLITAEETAQNYRVPYADDVDRPFIQMLADSKRHGIRVMNIDKVTWGRPAESEISEHRTASINFLWTETIEADRQKTVEEGEEPGKYIVFGGLSHFILNGRSNTNGLVDEGLGIPVLAFEAVHPADVPPFTRGRNPNGPDFYLPGDDNYPDTVFCVASGPCSLDILRASVQVEDVEEIKAPAASFSTGGLPSKVR